MKNHFFDARFLDSKVKTDHITKKEKWFGYLLGPSGALIINAITNFLMGWIIEKTKTKQGKARAYLFVCAIILTVTGILLYTIPAANPIVEAIWIMISYNLFFSFAFTIYNMSHSMMILLSTRNSEERGGVAVFNQIAAIMVTGIIAALVVPMVLLPMMGTSKVMWISVMSINAIVCFPLMLLEYFYTKERVTEEATEEKEKIPYTKQIKAVLTDNYTVLVLMSLGGTEIYASLAENGLSAQMAMDQLKPTLDGIYTVAVN